MSIVNKEPLVSIIITSYNRGKYIEKAITSCLQQDYKNIEIVISDNHSTDNTDEIVKKYIDDKRIKYFVNDTNIGMLPNFKIATEQRTNGKYLTYLSSDDYFCNDEFISAGVQLINKLTNIVLVVARNATLYENSGVIAEEERGDIFDREFMNGKDLFQKFPQLFFPGWGAVLMDRDKLLQTDIFKSKAQSLDYESNLKLMLQGNVAFIKSVSYIWRQHAAQASGTMNMETLINNLDFIENTYSFAGKLNIEIDINNWRTQVYYAYLNGALRRMAGNKENIDKIINYVKKKKKISIEILKEPRYFILFKIYRNYTKAKFLLKLLYPKLYTSINQDRGV